ncbi:MAG: hypothetical protein HZB99_00825 [Candidatus Harrisonbacteria bacterium]|nr:hypothetical protein [Candidatus Harrisonbacteria bacterium]
MAKCQKLNVKCFHGVAALPTVLLLGGLIMEIMIAATLSSYLLVSSEFGIRLGSRALFAARSGIQDALIRVVRDKNFTSSSYTLPVGNYSVEVSVCKDLPEPICVGDGKHKITAVGTAENRSRKLEAIVSVDSATGEARLQSLKEVEL